MTHYDEMLSHLIEMARIPGWKAQAWHRAKELASCRSGLWTDIDKALTAAMQSPSESPSRPSAP
jgi:hypothetical protein